MTLSGIDDVVEHAVAGQTVSREDVSNEKGYCLPCRLAVLASRIVSGYRREW